MFGVRLLMFIRPQDVVQLLVLESQALSLTFFFLRTTTGIVRVLSGSSVNSKNGKIRWFYQMVLMLLCAPQRHRYYLDCVVHIRTEFGPRAHHSLASEISLDEKIDYKRTGCRVISIKLTRILRDI